MADWKVQYLSALNARNQLEKADLELYNCCTRLANRNAELHAELRKAKATYTEPEVNLPSPSPPPPLVSYGFRRQTSPQPITESATLTQIRQDFAKAQQERADLQKRLDNLLRDFEGLEIKWKSDQRKTSNLSSNHSQLSVKLRDKEEELRGKAKLLDDVQDENVTLNLQLNMAEDQIQKLRKENQDLIDRWMARKGQEAEHMNAQSNFR